MFALRRAAAETTACDLTQALARAERQVARRGADDGGVPNACAEALGLLGEAMSVLSEAAGIVRVAATHVIAAAQADDAERALLAERYDDARASVDRMLEGAPEGARALLSVGAQRLSIHLRDAVYAIAPFPLTTGEEGLDLPPPTQGFVSHAEVADTLRRVEVALERIGRVRDVYEQDQAFLRGRAAKG